MNIYVTAHNDCFLIVSFTFLSEVFFPSPGNGKNTQTTLWVRQSPCTIVPPSRASPAQGSCRLKHRWPTEHSHHGPSLLLHSSLRRSLPQSSTTAGLAMQECFVPALPAWASFFCLSMRKPSKTFLYNTGPTWGLGTSTQILHAMKHRKSFNFSVRTYLSILQPS